MEPHALLPGLRLRRIVLEVTRTIALAVAAAVLVLGSARARAQPHDDGPPKVIVDAWDAYKRGDFVRARELLLQAYEISPQPEILFALGQTEFNLGHYREAIDYYQRFTATNPSADQAALAQQAIGAARMKLAAPPPPPEKPRVVQVQVAPKPPPPPHREWDGFDTAIAITGGVALLGGGALVVTGVHLADDRSGTLHSYDTRVNDAYLARTAGIATTAAGALVVGAALLRWRFHLVDTAISVEASPTKVGVSLEHQL